MESHHCDRVNEGQGYRECLLSPRNMSHDNEANDQVGSKDGAWIEGVELVKMMMRSMANSIVISYPLT